MTRFARRLAISLASAVALVGLSTTSAFARVMPPESATGPDTTPIAPLTQTTANPVPWLFAGALIALAIVGLYLLATALVHRTRTPSVG